MQKQQPKKAVAPKKAKAEDSEAIQRLKKLEGAEERMSAAQYKRALKTALYGGLKEDRQPLQKVEREGTRQREKNQAYRKAKREKKR
jgi:hypothetical protein